MSTRGIPDTVHQEVVQIVEQFNRDVLRGAAVRYVPRFRGNYLYLDRTDYGRPSPICRLRYTGAMDTWEFAIYKYSDERYDAEEGFFPGSQHVDGTA
ncbi:MAG: hypothetical protein ACRDI2_25810, partial [Chloroflexota bacterium]